MADRRTTTSRTFLALTVVVALVVPLVLFLVGARAVEEPAPDLWWLVLAPLVPGAGAILAARSRNDVGGAVAAVFALTVVGGFVAASEGDARAAEEMDARRYDDACNTATSGASVPFHVDAAFKDVGRVESHHLHGPNGYGLYGCTMSIAGEPDEAFASWRTQLLASGWRVVRDDEEVVVARRGVELSLYVVDDQAYLTSVEAGRDACLAGRPTSGTPEEPQDVEVAIASPPCS